MDTLTHWSLSRPYRPILLMSHLIITSSGASHPKYPSSPLHPPPPTFALAVMDGQAIVEAASLNEDGKRRKVVVTGCLAQRYSNQVCQRRVL